jgi:hypothetical protein
MDTTFESCGWNVGPVISGHPGEYEKARVSYWRDRVVRAANKLASPCPTNPPVTEAINKTVEHYLLNSNGGSVPAKLPKRTF